MAAVEVDTHSKADESLILYYHPASFYSQKVLFVLHEKKIKFKPYLVDLKGEQYESWYMKMNPKGEVPVLKDGEKVISDSSQINDYLEEKYSNENHPSLIPKKGSEYEKKERELRLLLETFPSPIITFGCIKFPELTVNMKMNLLERKLRSQLLVHLNEVLEKMSKRSEFRENYLEKKEKFKVLSEKVNDINAVLKELEEVEKMLKHIEEELSSHKDEKEDLWLFGENFTMADILLTIILHRLDYLGLWEKYFSNGKNPHLIKYYNRVKQREAYKKVFCSTPALLQLLCNESTKKGLLAATGVAIAIGVAATGVIIYQKLKRI
ncbi:ganglioside-induced differentiation-associated protein 1-like [Centruroides sculpturatus]|uniref:ganglioside-induced differentiation-associated protein 1-like n=1 Tax=Centruroides sculpturatus TaxID=218467 RepID=UPI000C6EB676|nr:ganglioside-induced differentiation-associated protein 1-like [Centruroides sculpturatus]